MNLQPAAAIIVKKTQLSEPIHKKTDPRPGRAYHLCKGLLADLGDYRLGHAFLAEMSKQKAESELVSSRWS